MSHDWPVGIEQHGDVNDLLRRKPFFREDVESGKLGSPPLMDLLRNLKPQWWFAAHLHVKFVATVNHTATSEAASSNQVGNPDEILIDDIDSLGDQEPLRTIQSTNCCVQS